MIKNKVAIIAGKGELPKQIAYALSLNNRDVTILSINQEESQNWVKDFTFYKVSIIEISEIIKILKENNIQEIISAGSVLRPSLKDVKLDSITIGLMSRIAKSKLKGDDSILSMITSFVEEQGFKVIGADAVLETLHVKAGIIGKINVTSKLIEDINLGKMVIDELGRFDIGQAVVVNDGRIIAIEAAEGTDKMLERVASLHNQGGVLVKLKKPLQNTRIDLPTIGVETVKKSKEAGLNGIAIGANSVLVLDKEKVVNFADKEELFIKAI